MLTRSRKIMRDCVRLHMYVKLGTIVLSVPNSLPKVILGLLKVDSKVIINFIKLARYKSRYHKEVGRQMSHTVLLKGRRERNE